MDFIIKDNSVIINNQKYIGQSTECDLLDIGKQKFDCKIYHFPGGKYEMIKSTDKIFRIPIPLGEKRYAKRTSFFDSIESGEIHVKRSDSVLRSQRRLHQIIMLNEWDYFVTLTFDDQKVDASDVHKVIEKSKNWLKNQVSRKGIAYVLVPEYHKKKQRIHLHCLVKGDPGLEFNDIYKVSGIKKPVRMESIKRYHQESRIQYKIFNVSAWSYGFSTAIEVYGSPGRLANYVLKYITKDFTQIFGKSYWVSKNLNLYPDVELVELPPGDFYSTLAKQYYNHALRACFKYVNKTGDLIEDLAAAYPEEKEVIRL